MAHGIIDRHANDSYPTHTCGGAILAGGSGRESHSYCDRCDWIDYDEPEDESEDPGDRELEQAEVTFRDSLTELR